MGGAGGRAGGAAAADAPAVRGRGGRPGPSRQPDACCARGPACRRRWCTRWLAGDAAYGGFDEIDQVPPGLIERLRHYFLTYKDLLDGSQPQAEIVGVYGREEAYEVIARTRPDYQARFAGLPDLLASALRG